MKIIYDSEKTPKIIFYDDMMTIIDQAYFYKLEILSNGGEHLKFSNWSNENTKTMAKKLKFIKERRHIEMEEEGLREIPDDKV